MQFKNINYYFTGDTFLIGKRSMEVIQKGSDSSNSKKDCKTEKYNRRPITILLCFSKINTNIYVLIWLIFLVKNHYDF